MFSRETRALLDSLDVERPVTDVTGNTMIRSDRGVFVHRSIRAACTLMVFGALMTTAVQAQHPSADGAMQTFRFLSDQYFDDVYFRYLAYERDRGGPAPVRHEAGGLLG